jgi:hypothetical protein
MPQMKRRWGGAGHGSQVEEVREKKRGGLREGLNFSGIAGWLRDNKTKDIL